MLTAITGINWGDEGKGRMVDLISQEYDIVARYQGGNNAGHTVKNERGKFVLNLLPSGILRPNVVCVMGNGMVIDPHHLARTVRQLPHQPANGTAHGLHGTPGQQGKQTEEANHQAAFQIIHSGLQAKRQRRPL